MPCAQLPPSSCLWRMVTVAAKHVLLSWGSWCAGAGSACSSSKGYCAWLSLCTQHWVLSSWPCQASGDVNANVLTEDAALYGYTAMSVVYCENWSYKYRKYWWLWYVFPLKFLLDFLEPEISESSFNDNGIFKSLCKNWALEPLPY